MGVYDHCAWFATRDEVDIVVRRLLAPTDRSLVFRTWMEERTIAFPGGKERTADLTGIFDDPSSPETVIVFEFQSRHDPKKLATTLLEVAVLRVEADPARPAAVPPAGDVAKPAAAERPMFQALTPPPKRRFSFFS